MTSNRLSRSAPDIDLARVREVAALAKTKSITGACVECRAELAPRERFLEWVVLELLEQRPADMLERLRDLAEFRCVACSAKTGRGA